MTNSHVLSYSLSVSDPYVSLCFPVTLPSHAGITPYASYLSHICTGHVSDDEGVGHPPSAIEIRRVWIVRTMAELTPFSDLVSDVYTCIYMYMYIISCIYISIISDSLL
jgi:hypothetical protein